jgi:hypothetical protein
MNRKQFIKSVTALTGCASVAPFLPKPEPELLSSCEVGQYTIVLLKYEGEELPLITSPWSDTAHIDNQSFVIRTGQVGVCKNGKWRMN